jgi:hypothetical protein
VVGTKHFPKKAGFKVQEIYFTQPNSTTFDISQWMRTPLGLYVFDVTYSSVLEHGFVMQEQHSNTSSVHATWAAKSDKLGSTLYIDGSDQEGDIVFMHSERGDSFVVTVGIYNHQVSLLARLFPQDKD